MSEAESESEPESEESCADDLGGSARVALDQLRGHAHEAHAVERLELPLALRVQPRALWLAMYAAVDLDDELVAGRVEVNDIAKRDWLYATDTFVWRGRVSRTDLKSSVPDRRRREHGSGGRRRIRQ